MKRYETIEKAVGETPLAALERYRSTDPALTGVPMAYAGRLDPMASGKLLILIGEECKRQSEYHTLDKAYTFDVLFGVASDTGDVLGLLNWDTSPPEIPKENIKKVAHRISGSTVALQYPTFSSKTVHGKPLHIWTLENRLNEITIPTATTNIYKLTCRDLTTQTADNLTKNALEKVETIPMVTEVSKQLGADFRRKDVRASWREFIERNSDNSYSVASFECVCSSGTYMRSLAEYIGKCLDTRALALSIHRTKIGRYQKLPFNFGFWSKSY